MISMSIDPLTIHVDRSTQIVNRSRVNSVSIDPPKKSIDRLSAGNRFMHRITWDSIFITKSIRIFVPAVRCNRFGAILAVCFSINRAHSFYLSRSSLFSNSLPNLSQFSHLSLSLGLSSSRKVEEDQKKQQGLYFPWVISLKLSFSPFSSLFRFHLQENKKKKRRRKEKEKE
jgi:hypothetical protein